MRDDHLRRAFRQLFKLVRETRSQQDELLRFYLELGYEQIWDRVWQLRAPPERVILFNLFRGFEREREN